MVGSSSAPGWSRYRSSAPSCSSPWRRGNVNTAFSPIRSARDANLGNRAPPGCPARRRPRPSGRRPDRAPHPGRSATSRRRGPTRSTRPRTAARTPGDQRHPGTGDRHAPARSVRPGDRGLPGSGSPSRACGRTRSGRWRLLVARHGADLHLFVRAEHRLHAIDAPEGSWGRTRGVRESGDTLAHDGTPVAPRSNGCDRTGTPDLRPRRNGAACGSIPGPGRCHPLPPAPSMTTRIVRTIAATLVAGVVLASGLVSAGAAVPWQAPRIERVIGGRPAPGWRHGASRTTRSPAR